MVRSRYIFLMVMVALVILTSATRIHWHPYWNHYFGAVEYSYPEEGEVFVVHVEPYGYALPQFAKYVIEHAFPEWNIVYDHSRKPHFVVRAQHFPTSSVYQEDYIRYDAPYMTLSGERYSLKKKRYRRNGLPLLELVAAQPKYPRQFSFPYLVWSHLGYSRPEVNQNRDKLAVLVSSNCIPFRSRLLSLLKQLRPEGVDGFGKCFDKPVEGWYGSLGELYSEYHFGFAMENHKLPGYVTEKILNVWLAGAIPIYWGDSEWVARYMNPEAYIDISRFPSLEEAAAYIVDLGKDEERLAKMRGQPLFRDGEIPELFMADLEKENKYTRAAGLFLRKEFDRWVKH